MSSDDQCPYPNADCEYASDLEVVNDTRKSGGVEKAESETGDDQEYEQQHVNAVHALPRFVGRVFHL